MLNELAEIRSRVYMLLSYFYLQRPNEDFVRKLKSKEFMEILKFTSNHFEEEAYPQIMEGLKLIETYVNSIRELSEEEIALDLAVDFTRLFRGVKEGYGPPPPYESVWRGEGRVWGEWTQRVLKEYADSGIGMDLFDELPDYIGIELKFMSLLCFKEAEAIKNNDAKVGLELQQLEKKFLFDHLTNWIPKFCSIVKKEAKTPFYKGVADLTIGILEYDRSTFLSNA